jgi:hypothetical protein
VTADWVLDSVSEFADRIGTDHVAIGKVTRMAPRSEWLPSGLQFCAQRRASDGSTTQKMRINTMILMVLGDA